MPSNMIKLRLGNDDSSVPDQTVGGTLTTAVHRRKLITAVYTFTSDIKGV
jgi:hypothetical protein